LYDGWLLRFASGYTRRANCVHPLYPSNVKLIEKIPYCEALFREKDILCRFKLNDDPDLTELDTALAAQGYTLDAPALLMHRPKGCDIPREQGNIEVSDSFNPEWMRFFVSAKGLDDRDARTFEYMLRHILPERRFILKTEGGLTVGCVLAVYERGFTSLFDLYVDEAHRGKGLGLSLVQQALVEGARINCPEAYLQVDETNERAIRLYRGMGFEVAYRYWYRYSAALKL